MRNHRDDVIERALEVLDAYGLADLTMRRLGRELGVQPSAIYHHFPSKQVLLGAVADEILARGPAVERSSGGAWTDLARQECVALRAALLAYRDGADVVATGVAFGFVDRPLDALVEAIGRSGLDDATVLAGARTLLHFVFGHTLDEQAHAQAAGLGAIRASVRDAGDFGFGLEVIIAGLEVRAGGAASEG